MPSQMCRSADGMQAQLRATGREDAPQMSGTQVTGFVNCSLIFHLFVSAPAPFMPSSCATLLFTTSPVSSAACTTS